MITHKNLTPQTITQAVKTSLAAVISIYIANLFKLPQGYWAAISAIVVMQSEVGTTLAASRDRLIGTAIGACMGAVFAAFLGGTILWFGAAVIITILICQFLGLDKSYRLACVTVAIVMLIYHPGAPWAPAIHRFLEVALGIVIALAITAIPVPGIAQQYP
jgi:uncharacterized membrane protein YgaE (UPF0421/DUF939 family)